MNTRPGRVRLIAGRWRGRRLPVASAPGLRPTPDRLRETLFNWLAPVIEGARCLDLFAGTGALGLEALSRGAAEVVLVEQAPPAAAALEAALEALEAGPAARLVRADALDWLEAAAPPPFDVVFVDPPFGLDVWQRVLTALLVPGRLAADALVFVEHPCARSPEPGPAWSVHRSARAGADCCKLLRRRTGAG